ncbi:MAG: Jag N-terminal domain-containing protein [Elusimicrobia bacterium]|nr:Jag N-terminal domain-containing protein [Elusimicrobiota bacterium]
MKQWVGKASSVEEAVSKGLKELGLRQDQVMVEVLDDKISSLLSMMGFRSVRVKITEKISSSRPTRRDERWTPSSRTDRADSDRDRPRDRRESRRSKQRDDTRPGGQDAFRRPRQQEVPQGSGRPRQQADPLRHSRLAPSEVPQGSGRQRDAQGAPPADRRRPPRDAFRNRPPQEPARPKPPAADAPVPSGEPAMNMPETPRELLSPEALLTRWKELMKWEDLTWDIQDAGNDSLDITLKTERADRLVGDKGETLEAFQHLYNLVLSRHSEIAPHVVFRMEGFKSAMEQRVIDIAQRAAEEVRRSRRPYRLDPMSPAERRLVHQTLANEPDVETVSEGEGPYRKVVVRPKGPNAGQGNKITFSS